MSQHATTMRASAILLAGALIFTLLTVLTPSAAQAAGQQAYVKNLSSSNCQIVAIRNDKRTQTVLPGKTSTIKALTVQISSRCKARWWGKGKWMTNATRIPVSQTTPKSIQVIKK